ncbi:MAG: copper resistance protein CopC [Hyphomonadaceae bacterium]
MRRRSFCAGVAGAFIALAGDAQAHAMLTRAEPAVGATVRSAVTLIRLRFTERIEPALCRVTIENGAGASVPTLDLAAEGDGRTLAAHVAPLAPGPYRVRWRAVSVDTHITEGDFRFTVAP